MARVVEDPSAPDTLLPLLVEARTRVAYHRIRCDVYLRVGRWLRMFSAAESLVAVVLIFAELRVAAIVALSLGALTSLVVLLGGFEEKAAEHQRRRWIWDEARRPAQQLASGTDLDKGSYRQLREDLRSALIRAKEYDWEGMVQGEILDLARLHATSPMFFGRGDAL